MSESLAPDPKPSCCLSSPQGTCEAHVTWSPDELRTMGLQLRCLTVALEMRRMAESGLEKKAWREAARRWIQTLEGR